MDEELLGANIHVPVHEELPGTKLPRRGSYGEIGGQRDGAYHYHLCPIASQQLIFIWKSLTISGWWDPDTWRGETLSRGLEFFRKEC